MAALCAYFGGIKTAHAVPSFARKYKTSCVTCHTVFPKLNPFGEAFRRDGFRFPSKDGSVDSDNVQAQMLPLGQDEYKKLFPNSVWPDSITQAPPLSMLLVAGAAVNLPNSSAKDAAGNTFAWNDFIQEAHFFGAGALNDKLTYFTEVTLTEGDEPVAIENAYLVWSDIVGPRHAFNLDFGRFGPTLNSFGQHGTYADDLQLPGISVGGLYNADSPADNPAEGYGHPDGLEVNGIVAHRVDYSLGWKASGVMDGLNTPNSQDAYAHLGFKIGGMSLDGEGPSGAQVANPKAPWSETALTVDVFGYHSLARFDNHSAADGTTPVIQDDNINALGGTLRVDVGSFSNIVGGWVEHHSNPYTANPAGDPGPPPVTGTPDNNPATGVVGIDEVNYVIFPWLVPAVRVELTRLGIDAVNGGGSAMLVKIQPAVAMLFRPNIKLVLAGDLEDGKGTPPGGDWGAAGGSIAPQASGKSKFEAEQITGDLLWAF